MNKSFTTTFFILAFFLAVHVTAQPGVGISFGFSSVPGTTAYPTAGATAQIVPVANQDDFGYIFAPVGMNVKFAGVTCNRFVVSTNGWIALMPSTYAGGIPAALSAGGYLNTNQLNTYAGGYPLIAPFWDDIATTAISYNYTAGALWVRWTCKIDKTNITAANNFWVKIDAATGVLSLFFSGSAYTISGTPSASIGIAGACTGD